MWGRAACIVQCPRRCTSALHRAHRRHRDKDKQRSLVGSPGALSLSVLGKRMWEKDKDNFIVLKSANAGPSGLGLGMSAGASAAMDVEMKDAEVLAQSGVKSLLLPR